jgi:nucleotide-binding universal stress UspA family protein
MSSERGRTDLVLFAYDGSKHAKGAIREAGRQLRNRRRAIVLTVWQPPAAIPFASAPTGAAIGIEEDLAREARGIADEGARLARAAGFDAEPNAAGGAPTWQRIVDAAEEVGAGIVVMGSHGRTGIDLVLMGSVASAAASHTDLPVLIVHEPAPLNGSA